MPADLIRDAQPTDWPAIRKLLLEGGLPLEGAEESVDSFLVVENGSEDLVGCAALEPYGDAWLLRSVAVRRDRRASGVGARMIHHLLARIDAQHPVVLVTTTAARWFTRFGFRRIDRDRVPPSVLHSVEFQGVCPSTAVVMMREVGRSC